MDYSVAAPGLPFTLARIHPDEKRRRPSLRSDAVEPVAPFLVPTEDAFDSSAPVAIDAVTEAALLDLQSTGAVPLAEAIHRYEDTADRPP